MGTIAVADFARRRMLRFGQKSWRETFSATDATLSI
jgi:hypothetical protein